jgi:hypothetical protein
VKGFPFPPLSFHLLDIKPVNFHSDFPPQAILTLVTKEQRAVFPLALSFERDPPGQRLKAPSHLKDILKVSLQFDPKLIHERFTGAALQAPVDLKASVFYYDVLLENEPWFNVCAECVRKPPGFRPLGG